MDETTTLITKIVKQTFALFGVELVESNLHRLRHEIDSYLDDDLILKSSVFNLCCSNLLEISNYSTKKNTSATDVRDDVRRIFAFSYLRAITTVSVDHRSRALRHHWIPRCQLRRFSDSNRNVKKIALQVVDFSGDTPETRTTNDHEFRHSVQDDGNGFYDDHLELFFGSLESLYGEVFSESDKSNCGSILASFALASLVRSPDDGFFFVRNLEDAIMSLGSYLDPFPVYAYVETDSRKTFALPAFTPSYSRETVDGIKVHSFVLTPDTVLILSNQPRLSRKFRNREMNELKSRIKNKCKREGAVLILPCRNG